MPLPSGRCAFEDSGYVSGFVTFEALRVSTKGSNFCFVADRHRTGFTKFLFDWKKENGGLNSFFVFFTHNSP